MTLAHVMSRIKQESRLWSVEKRMWEKEVGLVAICGSFQSLAIVGVREIEQWPPLVWVRMRANVNQRKVDGEDDT